MQDQQLEGRQEHERVIGDRPAPFHTAPIHARKRDYSYYKAVFGGRAMPFAYLDLDLLDQNIHDILARAAGKRVRLASKSLRSVAVMRRILAADPTFQGVMCFTAQEAAYLAAQGFCCSQGAALLPSE